MYFGQAKILACQLLKSTLDTDSTVYVHIHVCVCTVLCNVYVCDTKLVSLMAVTIDSSCTSQMDVPSLCLWWRSMEAIVLKQ